MISTKTLGYQITDENIDRSATLIERSGVADLINQFYMDGRGEGGRRPVGRTYTILAVLAVTSALIAIGRIPSLAEIYRVINSLTDRQLERVGMGLDRDVPCTYGGFTGWLSRRLVPLDSGIDLPARSVTNSQHRRTVLERTDEEKQASDLAAYRLHTVVNRLIWASIDDPSSEQGRGDVVIDESIIDLAGPADGKGSRDDKRRSAAYSGAYYVRDRVTQTVSQGNVRDVAKAGFGIGVTAVSRIGPPSDIYAVAPVITGIAIHTPTSASIEGMRRALQAHQENALDQRRGRHARLPYLTVDMGYNQKRFFTDACLDYGYSPVVRYPASWRTIFASDSLVHMVGGQPAGPVQIAGDFYCPCAQKLAASWKIVHKTVDLLKAADGFEVQDRKLERLLPLLMGTNSRPYRARTSMGRPTSSGESVGQGVRVDLVCPAVQGRVRCPLKPASMGLSSESVPVVEPEWPANRYRCCEKSQVTVPYSEDQWRMATWGMTPGSWEHATYFEAARAATEQRFSILKSAHNAGFDHLKWSPRREPMIGLIIGLWIAGTNRVIQDAHQRGPRKRSSVTKRLSQIEADLGRVPVKLPPRT